MKKIAKKIATVVTALIMTMTLGSGAFAAEKQQLSVKKLDKGNTYSVFKVMTAEAKGTDSSGKTIYSYTLNPQFENFFKNGVNGYKLTKNNEIAEADGVTLIGTDGRWTNTNTSKAAALASALEKYALLAGNGVTPIDTLKDDGVSKSFDKGYYLVAETASGSTDQSEVASKPVLVNLVDKNKVEITPKADTVTLEKKIVEGSKKLDENAVGIGDEIKYEITTKIPKYEANVDKTKLSFVLTDTFSKGLTYKKDSLNIDGFTKNTDYTISEGTGTKPGETTLVITFKTDSIFNHQGQPVVAKYSAVLNKDAIVNGANPNDIKLEYANNTNVEHGKKHLEDKVKTYTFGFGVHKVDGADNSDLPGAEFKLYKDSSDEAIKFIKEGNDTYTVAPKDYTGDTTDTVVSIAGKAPIIKGLDEGTYKLKETKAPDEYTKVEDITVKLEGIKDAGGEYTGQSKITVSGGGTGQQGSTGDENTNTTVTSTGNNIDINVFVKDLKGVSLPETGSKTALYFMIGGLLVVVAGAAYYMISRREENTN